MWERAEKRGIERRGLVRGPGDRPRPDPPPGTDLLPVADRWFCSCLGPTFPNRRFLISGTAHGLIDDLPWDLIDYPPAGPIFDALSSHDISWVNYHNVHRVSAVRHLRTTPRFFADAAAGTLPAVSIVDPDFGAYSEENPQDISKGEAFAAAVSPLGALDLDAPPAFRTPPDLPAPKAGGFRPSSRTRRAIRRAEARLACPGRLRNAGRLRKEGSRRSVRRS